MTKYAEIAAFEKMFVALESAAKSELVTIDDPTDSLRFWRDHSGVLYATSRTIVEPCAARHLWKSNTRAAQDTAPSDHYHRPASVGQHEILESHAMTPTELRALLKRATMTQKEAAALCGVTLRQFQNWIAGSSPIPILAENALIAEEGARADIAFERETGTQQAPEDAHQLLEFIAAEHRRRIATLERDLEGERAALAEMMERLNSKR